VAYDAGKIAAANPGDTGSSGDANEGQADDGSGNCMRYADADGDGYGAGEGLSVDCEASGYSTTNDDCDDSDPLVNPGASERCNELDDDCDSQVDEDVSYEWYTDADGDGFGSGDSLDDCDPPAGVAEVAGDCDDSSAAVNPDAIEVCNEIDDDCDALIDDEDESVDLGTAETWYLDGDGDGYGLASDTVSACASPSDSFVLEGTDCDDVNPEINPGATEVCDGEDNDCDSAIDDADASLDVLTTTEWHTDGDSDGFGSPAVAAMACVAPSGTVEDGTDCDDTNGDVNPDALEVCNEIDDDCDRDIDDEDSDVDLSTGTTYYTDSDGDLYGDDTTGIEACANPGGLVENDDDCDDGLPAVNPDATEICNGIDDDCDTDIDDDDPSLDTSTGSTWYRDADGDGLGVASPTTEACDEPFGYTDNSDDCDDTGFDDYDGDLVQDCEDSDADGDGLSSTYDADDLDDAIVRGPTGGTGADGSLSVTGPSWGDAGDYTLLSASASAGDSNIAVDSASVFASGDEVLIVDLQGSAAGTYGFYFVSGVSGSTLNLEPPLVDDFDASDIVAVQRVPQYTTVNVTGTLSPEEWDGEGGGVVAFRATGAVDVSGSVDASGMGYLGGDGVTGFSWSYYYYYQATSGGTWSEGPAFATSYGTAVDGGGGAVLALEDLSVCGGGGAYGTDGGEGDYIGGTVTLSPGASYGDSALAEWFFGSGGGGGTPDYDYDGTDSNNITGDGGNGGGLIAIYSATSITVSGTVSADGSDGDDAEWTGGTLAARGEIGGGGAGAGGQILLVSDAISITGSVTAEGGSGGKWSEDIVSYSGFGGDGGDGRTRLEYSSVSGSSAVAPTPSTGTYAD
jgi:hypothetical protein